MHYSKREFQELYRRCAPQAMRMALSLLHDEDEARDVVQEVFLKLWETPVEMSSPDSFVTRMVRNRCLNRIRDADTHQRILQGYPLGDISEDDLAEAVELEEQIRKALATLLTPRERQAVEKVFGEGLSYREAAQHLEVSVAAINKYLVNALHKLRKHLNPQRND
ncbi:MAG: sigma-70 family RNA polymerase sigma factor [Bacteroidales bacterium]|nr:sigma-70 family RNA polymerase sigma factor [Bacteroidales bacterium]